MFCSTLFNFMSSHLSSLKVWSFTLSWCQLWLFSPLWTEILSSHFFPLFLKTLLFFGTISSVFYECSIHYHFLFCWKWEWLPLQYFLFWTQFSSGETQHHVLSILYFPFILQSKLTFWCGNLSSYKWRQCIWTCFGSAVITLFLLVQLKETFD